MEAKTKKWARRVRKTAVSAAAAYSVTFLFNASLSNEDSAQDTFRQTNDFFVNAALVPAAFVNDYLGFGKPSKKDHQNAGNHNTDSKTLMAGYYQVETRAGAAVNLRSRPNYSRPPVGSLPEGTCIEVVGTDYQRSQEMVPVKIHFQGNIRPTPVFTHRASLQPLGPTAPAGCPIDVMPPSIG